MVVLEAHRVGFGASGRNGGQVSPGQRVEQDELEVRREMLADAMDVLNEREQRIFSARRLAEDPITLEGLSGEFGISRERVRQIEVRAFEKVQKAMLSAAKELTKPVPQLESAV